LKVLQTEINRLETVKKTTDREIRDLRANLATINKGGKEKETKLQLLRTTFNMLDSEHGADKQGLAEARAYIRELENGVMEYDTDLSHSKAFGATVARQMYNMMIALHTANRVTPGQLVGSVVNLGISTTTWTISSLAVNG
jgi:chromosome segregation ATPase